MSALMIKDLSVAEELDFKAMKAVHGGFAAYPDFPAINLDFSKRIGDVQQMIQQQMNISNVSGGNAFASGLTTTITPTMLANNNVSVS
ncbi:hypothetical protein [Paraburkholderia terrae]